ncbi:MAG: hypothetical protein OXI52_10380 [Caldilineaceae bacterium]|nr:hypothetical protein [Caldilineaceae bacterium]
MELDWEAAKRREDEQGVSAIAVGLFYGHVIFHLACLDRGWMVWIQVDARTIYFDDEAWPDVEKARDRADALYREKAVSWWTLGALMELLAENKGDAPPFQPQNPE